MTRIIRQALLPLALLGALTLAGCSAIKLGYEQLPSLLYWWLDSHVDFTDVQTPLTRQTLEQLQRWHRKAELPLYADWLARLAQAAPADIEAQQVCTYTAELQQGLDRLGRETVRLASPVMATLDERQRTHLQRYWLDKNRQWDKDWLQGPSVRRLQKRVDSAAQRYADFYGPLTPAQTDLVQRHVQQSVWTPEWGMQERLRRQQDLLGALDRIRQDRLSGAQAEAVLQGVWERWLQGPAATDRARMQAWSEQGCQHLAELHNSTSPAQRAQAARRLRAYEKDLRELAGRS